MKYAVLFAFTLMAQFLFGQSQLKDERTGCLFTLPWQCDECTMKWTGDCQENLPEGEGELTVYHQGEEIMSYKGSMRFGKFDGMGTYKDGMNEMSGRFINGQFAGYLGQYYPQLDTATFNKTAGWETKTQVTKQIDNLYFIFPSAGYAYENRDDLVAQCLCGY